MNIPPRSQYIALVDRAIEEDAGCGDVTTECLGVAGKQCSANVIAKEDGVIAGLFVMRAVFERVDPAIEFEAQVKEGELVKNGTKLATLRGRAGSVLAAERVALNFLQRLSGIATFSFQFARAVKGSKAVVTDTRKTTPGLRLLEKYAVRAGGARNHRFGLDDAILIKDNHIAMAGGIANAVETAKKNRGHTLTIEVEASSMDQVKEALDAGADIIMLDNMRLKEIEEAAAFIDGRAVVEVSGNVSMINVTQIAMCGVDVISVGALTHSSDALDIGLDFF